MMPFLGSIQACWSIAAGSGLPLGAFSSEEVRVFAPRLTTTFAPSNFACFSSGSSQGSNSSLMPFRTRFRTGSDFASASVG